MSFRTRLAVVLAIGGVQTVLYRALNQHPLVESRELSLTWIDRAVQFLPWTTVLYFVLLAAELVLPLLVRERAVFRRMIVAYGLAMSAAFATYAVFPTRYPRPESAPDGALGAELWTFLASIDTPECCLPSGHVIVPLLAAWALRAEGRGRLALAVVVALVPSVITTRQHYAWDVAAAVVLVVLAWRVSARFALSERYGAR